MRRIGRLALLAAALVATIAATSGPSDQPFTVVDNGPTGTVPHENLGGGIWLLFSSPVVPLKTLEKPATSSPIMTITPDLPGVYRWYGSRLLSLEPAGQLQPATEYVVKVAPTTRSLDGTPLSGPSEFRFKTEALSLVATTPSGDDVPTREAKLIQLTLNFPVDLTTIAKSIRVEVGGKAVAFQAGRPRITSKAQLGPYENADRFVTLSLAQEPPRDTSVTVRVLKGAKPQPDSFGADQELSASFHTLLPLSLKESEASAEGRGVTVSLRFNHPIEARSFPSNVRLDRSGYSVQDHSEVSGSWAYLYQLPVPFETKFSVTLLAGVQDTYGQTLGADQTVPLSIGPAEAYVSFRGTGQRLLESQFPPIVAVEMQNIQSGSYGMARLSDPFGQDPPAPTTSINTRVIPRNQRYFQFLDLSKLLNKDGKGAAGLSWKFRGLFYGNDSPQDINDSLVVQVTDIGASVHLAYNSLVVAASSLASGQPLAGADVSLRNDGQTVATGKTDANGLGMVPLSAGLMGKSFQSDGKNAEVVVSKGNDRIVVRPADMQPLSWNGDEPFSADRPHALTYLWSDRGIYRPGETVSFAGIDRDLAVGKLKAIPGSYRVDLMDASDESDSSKPLASVTGTSSTSGSFSGSIALPGDVAPGQWVLQYSRTGANQADQTGQAWIQVASFRRVAFSVDVTVDRERAFVGDSLAAKIVGSYLAGGTVAKGTYNWYWSRREIWYQPPGDALADYSFGDVEKGWPEEQASDSGPISTGGVTTAKQSLQDADPGRVYTYDLEATVQDVDRQAISGRASATVFASQQLLGAKITSDPSSDDSLYFVTKGDPFTVKVVSVDPDGKPYPSGAVQGKLTREEWAPVREAGVGGDVDTHWEQQLTVETDVYRDAGSALWQRPGRHAEGRLLPGGALRPGRPGTPQLHPALVLFDRVGRGAVAALRREAHRAGSGQEDLLPGRSRPDPGKEPTCLW